MPLPKITAPTIYPKDKSLAKKWHVKYRTKNDKLIKLYGNINNYNTVAERFKAAKALIKKIENEHIVHVERRTLVRDLSKLLEQKKPTLAKKSYQTYLSILALFARWYHPAYKNDKDVDVVEFLNYLREQNKHNNYVRKCVNLMRSFFDILVRKGMQKNNPFFDVRVRKIKPQSKLPFHTNHVTQIKGIVQQRNPQLWDAIEFLYYLYFRPGEIRKLKIEHIMFEDLKVIASDDVVKDKDNYLKVVPQPMISHILKYKNYPPNYYIFGSAGKPGTKQLATNYLSLEMTKILRELNYSRRYTLYSWVHTGIKNAAMSDIPIVQLQLQKGHSDLKMFSEYLKDLGVEDCSNLVRNFPAL